ncbi:MAG: hypothetical protein KAJ59_04020, partial [Thermodesulfovibrionia bacterium]|nr:hypothetical protein [Thermodesulfovibrionia bacterium]
GKTAGYQMQNSLRRFLSFLPRIGVRDKLQRSLPARLDSAKRAGRQVRNDSLFKNYKRDSVSTKSEMLPNLLILFDKHYLL